MNGGVKLIKMPPVLNPLDSEPKAATQENTQPAGSRDSKLPTSQGKAALAQERSSQEMGLGSMGSMNAASEQEGTILLKNDIEKFEYAELTLDQVLVTSIDARKKSEFVDPFGFDEESKDTIEEPEVPVQQTKAPPAKGKVASPEVPATAVEVDDGSFKYRLGKK